MVEHAGAFTQAVHGPNRRAYVHAGHAEPGGDDGAYGAAATEIGAMGVLLERYVSAFA